MYVSKRVTMCGFHWMQHIVLVGKEDYHVVIMRTIMILCMKKKLYLFKTWKTIQYTFIPTL